MNKTKRFLSAIISVVMLLSAIYGVSIIASAEPAAQGEFIESSLTLGEEIISNYYIDYNEYINQGADTVYYSYNGSFEKEAYELKENTVSLTNLEDATIREGKMVISVPQAAPQIAEPTTIRIYNSSTNETIDSVQYSAKTYCDNIIDMSDAELLPYCDNSKCNTPFKLKKICKSLVAYSKSSQGVFTDYMAKEGAVTITDNYNEDLDLNNASYNSDYNAETDNTKGEKVWFRAISFVCTSNSKMRFYLNVDENDTTNYGEPVISGPSSDYDKSYTVEDGTKNYYIQVNGLQPQDFDDKITIEYAGARVSISVLDYAARVINASSASSALKTLAKSLIVYYNNAADYFVPVAHTPAAAVQENTVNATCTAAGSYDSVVYCSECGAEISRTHTSVPASGHSYESVVTAPTCTGQGYTTYTCSTCGDTYTDNYVNANGHSESSTWSVKQGATDSASGTEVKTCTVCGTEMSTRTVQPFTHKFVNRDSYLYRVGNGNNVKLGSLFNNESGANISEVTATVTKLEGTASGTFTANSSDWRESTIKFSGLGVVNVTLKHGTTTSTTLKLEVVAGNNVTSGALTNITTNTVLLGDMTANKKTINNKATLYGNGFTITDVRTDTSGANGAYITMSGGATINNAVLMGKVYSTAVTDGTSNQEYAPGVWITGDANIYNSYVSEAKNALEIKEGNVNLVNSTFSGGSLANIEIQKGETTLENCTTQTSDRGGLKGLGIRVSGTDTVINLLGSLTQYNWLSQNDIPSTYSSVISSVYNDSNYAYSYNSNKYVNMGVFFMSGAGNITSNTAQRIINDQTNNNYGFIEKSYLGYTGTLYTAKASMGSVAMLTAPAYSPRTNGQYFVLPSAVFDYTNKNYIPKVAGDNNYCYYDSGTKSVQISFDKVNASSAFSWDPMILTATKNGNTISNYSVKYKKVGDTSYTTATNSNISFGETADYEVVYTYTDPYNYDKDGNAFNHTYEKTVNISVNAVEPDQTTYYASFEYTGAAGTYNAKQVIGTDNKTYVMPDVSQTSSTIGSTTVGGKTVYYPIVTVPATSSNGNTAYSSGKGYYFAPVFSELNITDYDQDTGATKYTYNKSSTTWPHGKSNTAGPDSAIFGYASGATYANQPYGRSMNTQYYKYGKNNNGLCYTSTDIEKDNAASNHLVQYHYVSNDGTTYYFYIQYAFGAMTYSGGSCLAEGTEITMADGTKKAIEDVQPGEEVLTWSYWNGCIETKPVLIKYNHGVEDYRVLNLTFSDGTTQRVITDHGFFDVNTNNTVYIGEGNVDGYIGHKFIKNENGENKEIELVSYNVTTERVGSYSILSANNITVYANDMLTVSNEVISGFHEFFDMGDGMKYDEAKMQQDIETYGVYTYDDFKDYISEDLYEAFNGQYYKVLVGKGIITFDDILYMIEYYVNPYETI